MITMLTEDMSLLLTTHMTDCIPSAAYAGHPHSIAAEFQ